MLSPASVLVHVLNRIDERKRTVEIYTHHTFVQPIFPQKMFFERAFPIEGVLISKVADSDFNSRFLGN